MPESEEINNRTIKGFGIRHVQSLLCFWGLTITLALRVNMSVAIVIMTKSSIHNSFEIFDWSEATQGIILSSFFWGYIITMIPSGILTHKFSAKLVFFLAMLGASICTVLIPLIASFGWEFICVLRIAIGLCQGCIYPAVYSLMAKWIHPSERRMSVVINGGAQFGIFFMLMISGPIAVSSLGWPGIFYISALLGFFWSFIWFIFGANSPSESKTISTEEKRFLEETIHTSSNELLHIPWTSILTSIPFLALLVTQCTQGWGYHVMLTEIPKYMSNILNFNIKSNSFMSSLPYLAMFILSLVMSPIADLLVNRSYITVGFSRKLFNSIGMWLPMISLIGLSYVDPEKSTMAVIILMCAVGFNAGINAGFLINHIDLSPNFASTLFGISNFFGNIASIIGPLFVGYVVTDAKDVSLWQIVFLVTAGIYFVGNLIFLLFSSGSIQSWNAGNIEKERKSFRNKTIEK